MELDNKIAEICLRLGNEDSNKAKGVTNIEIINLAEKSNTHEEFEQGFKELLYAKAKHIN